MILFVTLGLPAGALGVAWPQMRVSLGAPLAGLGLLLAAFTAAYFVASAGTGALVLRLGTPFLLATGCALSGIGLLGIGAANQFWMVLAAGLLAGAGSGLIDAATNAHVSLNRGVRYMGWLHASWALGAALGPPLVVAAVSATGSWRTAFVASAGAFFAVGVLVGRRRADWAGDRSDGATALNPTDPRPRGEHHQRALLVLTSLFLIAGGLEGTAGTWSFSQLTGARSVAAWAAGWGVSLFFAGLAGGRVALGLLGNRATPARLLDASVAVTAAATVGFWLAPPLVSTFLALPLIGLGVSALFPLLLSITPSRVGVTMTTRAVGYGLAAGTLGGGGLPAATGLVLQAMGLSALGPVLTLTAAGMALLHVASRVAEPLVSRAGSRRSARLGPGPPAW